MVCHCTADCNAVSLYCSGLLSGHLMATVLRQTQHVMSWYNGELLDMAHDIGNRLLPAFNTSTGMPFPRVCFRHCFVTMVMSVCLQPRLMFCVRCVASSAGFDKE